MIGQAFLKKLYVDIAALSVVLGSAAVLVFNFGWTAVDLVVRGVMGLFWYLKYKPIQCACVLCAALIVGAVIWLSYEIYLARRRA